MAVIAARGFTNVGAPATLHAHAFLLSRTAAVRARVCVCVCARSCVDTTAAAAAAATISGRPVAQRARAGDLPIDTHLFYPKPGGRAGVGR